MQLNSTVQIRRVVLTCPNSIPADYFHFQICSFQPQLLSRHDWRQSCSKNPIRMFPNIQYKSPHLYWHSITNSQCNPLFFFWTKFLDALELNVVKMEKNTNFITYKDSKGSKSLFHSQKGPEVYFDFHSGKLHCIRGSNGMFTEKLSWAQKWTRWDLSFKRI